MNKLSELKKSCYRSAEVMELFEIDRPTLCRMQKNKVLNPVKLGGLYFYSKKEVHEVYDEMVKKLNSLVVIYLDK